MSFVPERHFLDWNAPLLQPLCGWLLERRDILPGMLLVVPTGQSGRRLREALAEVAGGAVLGPRCVTPDWFLGSGQLQSGSRAGVRVCWADLLMEADLEQLENLFPVAPPEKSFAWAMQVGGLFQQVRENLAEGDRCIEDVLGLDNIGNRERWRELLKLEHRLLGLLDQKEMDDPVRFKRRHARTASLPPGIDTIVIACVPDPLPLVRLAWQNHLDKGATVAVIVHAPESEAETFSAWGEPLVEHWRRRPLALEGWRERVIVVRDAAEAGMTCVQQVAARQTRVEECAIGMCSMSYVSGVAQAFAGAGWKTFNPEGRPVLATGLGEFLRSLEGCLTENVEFAAVSRLLRSPFGRHILDLDGNGYESACALDALAAEGLPRGFEDAVRLAKSWTDLPSSSGGKNELKRVRQGSLLSGEFAILSDFIRNSHENADWLWEGLFRLSGGMEEGVGLEWESALIEVSAAFAGRVGKVVVERLIVLAEVLRSGRHRERGEDEVLDLQGWLELSYDPASHVLMVGFHEGSVPEGGGDDPFLPDSLCVELGLRCRGSRHARDAFLLAGEWASRQRVDVILCKTNPLGEPEKPSKLLLQCVENELPDRVLHVFKEINEEGRSLSPWQRDWQLRVPKRHMPMRYDRPLSPSAIKDYLLCPFRFYAKRVLRMRREEWGRFEMNARDLGNVCHLVLERFGADELMRGCEDERKVVLYLDDLLERVIFERYGGSPGLPVLVQVHSARERLRRFAAWQVEDVRNGWRIVASECVVGRDGGFEINGHPFLFTIDRIDFHEESGRWRVMDYKTRAKALGPRASHLSLADDEDHMWHLGGVVAAVGRESGDRAWTDVQLPLYAEGVRRLFNSQHVPEIGYMQLPKAVGEVAYAVWEGFDEGLLNSALEWTAEAVSRIRRGQFWPPRDLRGNEAFNDEFKGLAPDGLGMAVAKPDEENFV